MSVIVFGVVSGTPRWRKLCEVASCTPYIESVVNWLSVPKNPLQRGGQNARKAASDAVAWVWAAADAVAWGWGPADAAGRAY